MRDLTHAKKYLPTNFGSGCHKGAEILKDSVAFVYGLGGYKSIIFTKRKVTKCSRKIEICQKVYLLLPVHSQECKMLIKTNGVFCLF